MAAKFSGELVYVEGFNQLRRLLKPIDELVAAPWKRAMTDLADAGAAAGQSAAPYNAGYRPYSSPHLRDKIYARIQKKPFPEWAAVRARGKRRPKGAKRQYDYGRLLEYSPKHGHRGWFQRSVSAQWGSQAEARLAKAGDEIVENWGED